MINTLWSVARMIMAILPFAILCVSSAKVNYEKPDRSRQYFMPIVTVIYVVITMIFANQINSGLLKLIDNIPKWISAFAGFLSFLGPVGSILNQIADIINSLIEKINMEFWIFFISNTVIISAYLGIKKTCLSIMKKKNSEEDTIHTNIASHFYEYFSEKNKWCIQDGYVQVREFLKVFYYASVVLSIVLMLVSSKFYSEDLIKAIFYPVYGILVVGELYFYLDGLTKREYSETILGEDEGAYKNVNYTLLRKFLRNLFEDKLLAENTSINNDIFNDVTNDEVIQNLEKSEDPKINTFALYYKALNETGFELDQNYISSSLDLLQGKSILFNNPFYNDLIPYVFYPMNRALLSHKKVLIVLGRHSIEEDIIKWVEDGISAITNIPFLWKVNVLSNESDEETDIGIITRSDVSNINLHNTNSKFLEEVGFVVILEPSKLISTAQIGLSLIVSKCIGDNGKKITYCMCDKNCDGLIDAMSHILKTSITEVSATKKHLGTSSYMCWEADADYLHHRIVPNISRYLGLGTELSFAALKNQVSKTKWFGGECFPVVDMHWIDKQYYYDLMKYAGLPTTQNAMDERFKTSSNYWSANISKHNYLTVEDESYNMFEILRNFATRSTEQGFINVISSEYLLKDYMAENASIFETDAKAIPRIVADFVRSNRNVALKLILMMSTYPVEKSILSKELSLIGIDVYNLRKQLWYEIYCCYSDISTLNELSDNYMEAVEQAAEKKIIFGSNNEYEVDISVLIEADTFNVKNGHMEHTFEIIDQRFLKKCVRELQSAGYISEDEEGDKYYLGAELIGHIYQKYLPGQFFTFGGKYYEMRYLTADGKILVRRAADHITGRPYYRQIRSYTISGSKTSEQIGSIQNIAGLKVSKEYADVCVSTEGYYKMERYNDFVSAKRVVFEGEKSGIPNRVYRNKEILKIELPEESGTLSSNVRYTIATMINEVFRTLFAENQAYIVAVTDDTHIEEESVKPLTYSLKSDGCELTSNCIYIIEDSQLDLGLTVAVERNIQRILEIVHDYFDWHVMAIDESLNPPLEPESPVSLTPPDPVPEEEKVTGLKKIGNWFKKGIEKIKNLFKRKKKEDVDDGSSIEEDESVEPKTEEEIADNNSVPKENEENNKKPGIFARIKNLFKKKKKDTVVDTDDVVETEEKPQSEEQKEPVNDEVVPKATDETTKKETDLIDSEEGKDIPSADEEGAIVSETEEQEKVEAPDSDIVYVTEDEKLKKNPLDFTREPYHKRHYLLYGDDIEPSSIDIVGTLEYLTMLGLEHNPLKQARVGKEIADYVEATFTPGKANSRYCDFCGCEIYGVEYETLADGRERCINCGRTAIKTGEEFKKIFEDVKRNLESFFGIKINAGIRVEMVNSKKLHKALGKTFIPTPKSDGRVLGVAISDKSGYTLMVENGSPRMASMLTMAHELTHIWQYLHWNDKDIVKKYGKNLRLEVYEGMAKWVEIQYAYLINEPAVAKREELITVLRQDEYGRGFLRYLANYPFSLGTVVVRNTPFMFIEQPLDPQFCGDVSYVPHIPIGIPEDKNKGGSGKGNGFNGSSQHKKKKEKGTKERNPNSVKRYAYECLNDSEKLVYDDMLNAINSHITEVTELSSNVTDGQIKKIIDYVQIDHPEIFWFQHGATFYFDANTRIVNKVDIKYCMTQEEAETRKTAIANALSSFMDSINDRMSDYDVAVKVYENIIELVDYDTVGLEKQKKTEGSAEIPDDLRSIYGVFVNRKAVCAGYAKATQYLMNLMGIECTYVTSDTHAWNLIKLEGEYYHLDTTWGDSSNTEQNHAQSDKIDYDCFCITTEEVEKLESHKATGTLPLPQCTATKCNYHRRNGLFLEKYDLGTIRDIVLDNIMSNVFDSSFKCIDQNVFEKIKHELVDNGKMHEVIQYVNLKSKTKLKTEYRYSVKDERLIISFYLSKQ